MSNTKKIRQYLFSFLFAGVVYFTGCSQNLPEVRQANASVIFEYEDETELPQARLSVFVESVSDPRRFETLKIKSVAKGFEWETESLSKIQNDKKKYAGYTNFVMPDGERIPTGKYNVIYINADDEEIDAELSLDYNSKYYELKASDVPSFMKKHSGINKIAIYNEDKILLFYGEKTSDLTTTRDIWNQYSEADYYNDIWVTPNNTVICILPKELVQPEKVE